MFESYLVQTDVTCVQIVNEHLFAGTGGDLQIYKLSDQKLIKQLRIFEGKQIFGIKPNATSTKLVVHGEKHLAILSLAHTDLTIETRVILSDWILDTTWLDEDQTLATVFMHNKVTIWKIDKSIVKVEAAKCAERCILYSAHLCFDNIKTLVALAGTVFSDILVWKPSIKDQQGVSPVLKRLQQHKGVIFAIQFNRSNGYISSVSDDRSACLWKVDSTKFHAINQENCDLLEIPKCQQVYGHSSRIFQTLILDDCFLTAGEDSLLIVWSFQGKLLRKIDTHQGGSIWSLSYDSDSDTIFSGGSDGGILSVKPRPFQSKDVLTVPNSENPKLLGILHSGSIICLSENANLYTYRSRWQKIAEHPDLKKYSILKVSPCKKLFALAGFEGNVYIYQEKHTSAEQINKLTLKNQSRIYALHWLNCATFLVTQTNGLVGMYFIYNKSVHFIQNFILPPCKERWPTCIVSTRMHIIMGDRRGNIHNFKIGLANPINTVKRAHSHLGVSNLHIANQFLVSLGRDGFTRKYLFNKSGQIECTESNKCKFSWLLHQNSDYCLAFSGDNFVIADRLQRVLFETTCGGGHRSWDYLNFAETFLLCFIKQKVIHIVKINLNQYLLKSFKIGFHVHEINCLKILQLRDQFVAISGGEDTILRISKLPNLIIFEQLKVHLSSIRTISYCLLSKTSNFEEYLLVTAGGRSQIITWLLQVEYSKDNFSINCIEKFNLYEQVEENEAETRIMDLSILESLSNEIIVCAGCSDGIIKIFSVDCNLKLTFQQTLLHSNHSITKISYINNLNILTTMATDGIIKFWSISNQTFSQLTSLKLHQSGINSFSHIMTKNYLYLLSGGDDNNIKLTQMTKDISLVNAADNSIIHCAQISGALLLDKYFITSGIDQRITISKWNMIDNKLSFQMINQYETTIADPQGLEAIISKDSVHIWAYGNGFEHLKIDLKNLICDISS